MEYLREKTRYVLTGRRANYHEALISDFHWHDNLEICRVINKPCKFIVEGKMLTAMPGDVVVFDEYLAHQFVIEQNDTDIFIAQMNLNCFINQEVPLNPVRMHITNEEIKEIPGLDKRIDEFIDIIISEKSASQSVSENPFIHSVFAALYYLLMRHFPAKEMNNKSGRNEFYRIIEYINNHYTEDITVATLSKVMFASSKTLTKLFRKFSGMGINDYVNYLRIKAVNQRILHGDNITNAALECGFKSVRTFNNVYKKIMNVTPTEFLTANKKNK